MRNILCGHSNVLILLHIISLSAAFLKVGETLPQFHKVLCRIEALLHHKMLVSLWKSIQYHCIKQRLTKLLTCMMQSNDQFLRSDKVLVDGFILLKCSLANCLIRLMTVVVSSLLKRC